MCILLPERLDKIKVRHFMDGEDSVRKPYNQYLTWFVECTAGDLCEVLFLKKMSGKESEMKRLNIKVHNKRKVGRLSLIHI